MRKILQGIEAIARGRVGGRGGGWMRLSRDADSEIMAELAKYKEIYTEWSPNEKVAVEVAHGASLAGGRALPCMKHVGLNRRRRPFHDDFLHAASKAAW